MRRLFVITETPTNYILALMDRTGLMSLLRPLVDRARIAKGISTYGNQHPIDGVPELLSGLTKSYPLGVLTNRARREAYGFLEQNNFWALQEFVPKFVTLEAVSLICHSEERGISLFWPKGKSRTARNDNDQPSPP